MDLQKTIKTYKGDEKIIDPKGGEFFPAKTGFHAIVGWGSAGSNQSFRIGLTSLETGNLYSTNFISLGGTNQKNVSQLANDIKHSLNPSIIRRLKHKTEFAFLGDRSDEIPIILQKIPAFNQYGMLKNFDKCIELTSKWKPAIDNMFEECDKANNRAKRSTECLITLESYGGTLPVGLYCNYVMLNKLNPGTHLRLGAIPMHLPVNKEIFKQYFALCVKYDLFMNSPIILIDNNLARMDRDQRIQDYIVARTINGLLVTRTDHINYVGGDILQNFTNRCKIIGISAIEDNIVNKFQGICGWLRKAKDFDVTVSSIASAIDRVIFDRRSDLFVVNNEDAIRHIIVTGNISLSEFKEGVKKSRVPDDIGITWSPSSYNKVLVIMLTGINGYSESIARLYECGKWNGSESEHLLSEPLVEEYSSRIEPYIKKECEILGLDMEEFLGCN